MKRAATALRSVFAWLAAGFGLEGTFLAIGTVCLAVAASAIAWWGPWLVVGAIAVLVAVALALPRKV